MENTLFPFEDSVCIVCGADEAGRGPLAGPVVAAAVVLPDGFPIEILDDSKKLSEKKRLEAEKIIKEKAIWAVYRIEPDVIDKINILQSSLLAMKLSYEIVCERTKVDLLLVDGNKIPDVNVPCEAIVKGDSKIPEIMAASILAKCERDRIMEEYGRIYPQYGYQKHKGYPTKEHIEAIEKYGPSPIQRMSFMKKNSKEDKDRTLF